MGEKCFVIFPWVGSYGPRHGNAYVNATHPLRVSYIKSQLLDTFPSSDLLPITPIHIHHNVIYNHGACYNKYGHETGK